MEEIRALLETQPLFALFLTIALGYLVGEINETAEIALLNPAFWGLRFPELVAKLPFGVKIAVVRRQHHNRLPADDLVLQQNDVLLESNSRFELRAGRFDGVRSAWQDGR